jgi:WD40 repeat protein
LAASASGDVVACASANSSVVTAWRPGVGTPRAPRPAAATVKADDWVLCGAVAPRGDWVCAAGRGKFLHLWRVSDDRSNGSNGSALAFSSTESERFETVPIGDAPWHKDFTTCVAALGETDAAYGAQDWSARLVRFGTPGKTSAGAGSGSGSDQSSLIGRLSASPTAIAASAELLSAQSLVAVGAEDGSVRVFDTRAGSKPVADLVDHADHAVSDSHAERQTRALCLGRDARFLLHGSLQGGWVREGPRGSWRVRHGLRRGLTAAALVPESEAWANVAMVSMDGFGVAALDCETGALDDEANRVASEPCSNLCAFASVDAVVSHAAETVEGNARRRGWFARVFG